MSKLEKYRKFYQGPWLDSEENDSIAADFYAAVGRGERHIALIWSWCGGSEISHAVDGRGRHWEEYNGVRRHVAA